MSDYLAIARYNPDGSFDTSFGNNGKVTTRVGQGSDLANAVALQSDGKIVIAGVGTELGSSQVTLARYTNQNQSAPVIELDYNFRSGDLGWTADFSDYPPATNTGNIYELEQRIRFMPRKLTRLPQRGFYIQGHNRSDDLFMFLKRRLTTADGIAPNQTYRIEYVVTFASNAASGCIGPGSPGESVYLKVGASPIEPLAVLQTSGWLRMNVDKGDSATSGTAASVAGNIANGIPCQQALPLFPFALVQRSHQHTANITADANGILWLLVGTDSGFEGLTRLYYQNIRVKLIPQ